MNALIVGGAGFLGTNLTRACLRAGETVTVVDSLEPRLRSTLAGLEDVRDRVRFVQADMRDVDAMKAVVEDQDVIFNCAGQTSHPISMSDPTFDIEMNCKGHVGLLEAVRASNPKATVVYTSTSTVVGKAVRTPIDETHPELPLDMYSANKLAGEKYYRIYHTAHGLKTVSIRFANLYGPYGKGFPEFGFINYFIHLAWARGEIRLFGHGNQQRNVLFVDDACEALRLAAREPRLHGQVAFAAHESHVSVGEIARQIVATLGRGSVTHVEWPEDRKRIEVDDVEIASTRFRDLVSWRATRSLVEGLEITRAELEGRT